MPLTKYAKKREPQWRDSDRKAQKEGLKHSVYSVNGDVYTGEWSDNKKCGKGTQTWKKSGTIYDGDWKNDMRDGFGTYSIQQGGVYVKQYAGGWKNDMRDGFGTHFYGDDEYYEGEWSKDKRCGWGRMYYSDGSIYEGEWFDDKQHGQGLLLLANGNRYEGMWKNHMKNGDGRFLYLDKGQIYTGFWVDNIAKCGTVEDFDRNNAPDPPKYPIPECTLLDKESVLRAAKEEYEQNSTSHQS
jgi:hypothetical protein